MESSTIGDGSFFNPPIEQQQSTVSNAEPEISFVLNDLLNEQQIVESSTSHAQHPIVVGEQQDHDDVDDWWLQQHSSASAEERQHFQPISDMWPFRPRFNRFTQNLRYKGPFLHMSHHHRSHTAETPSASVAQSDSATNSRLQTTTEASKISKEDGGSSSSSTKSSDESTDLEQEIKIAQASRRTRRKTRDARIEHQIHKFAGPIAITDEETAALLRSYVNTCNDMKVPVVRVVVKALAHDAVTVIDLSHCSLSYETMRPLISVLEKHDRITTLILESCGLGLGDKGGQLVAMIIEHNTVLKNLNLSKNFLGPRTTPAIASALEKNRTLEYLNLSHNQFVDENCAKLLEVMCNSNKITALDISGNEISSETSLVLTDWLLQPDCKLKIMNLGWSTIRRNIASSVCSVLRLNWSLRMVDLSYNGLSTDGALVIGEALRTNNRVKSLDLSGNRLRNEAAKMLAEGLTKNTGLHSICLKDNAIGIEGVMSIVVALSRNRQSGLRVLDLTGIPVNQKVVQVADVVRHRIQTEYANKQAKAAAAAAAAAKAAIAAQLAQQLQAAGLQPINKQATPAPQPQPPPPPAPPAPPPAPPPKDLPQQPHRQPAVPMNDFEFLHAFFEVPQRGLEIIVVHRFSDLLQKHCSNIRVIDIFRSCAPGGDQGVSIPLFVRGFMKQMPMTADELKHTAFALDPESVISNFVTYHTFYENFRQFRRTYFGTNLASHRLIWVAKYKPLVSAIAEAVWNSSYNDPQLKSVKEQMDEAIKANKGRLKKRLPSLPPMSKAQERIQKKNVITKGAWLLRPLSGIASHNNNNINKANRHDQSHTPSVVHEIAAGTHHAVSNRQKGAPSHSSSRASHIRLPSIRSSRYSREPSKLMERTPTISEHPND